MTSRKLNIAVWHNLPSGGGKRALYEHIKGLSQRGHNIHVWCPSTADQSYLPLDEFAKETVLPFDWERPGREGRIEHIMFPYREVETKLAAMERHCTDCAKQISKGNYDVLFVASCCFFASSPMARLVEKIPSILYLQEPFRRLYEALPELPWLALPATAKSLFQPKALKMFARDLINIRGFRLQAREERRNAGNFDKILVNSLYSRESVLRSYGLDAEVCYLGIDGDYFKFNGAPKERFVIGLGSITPAKGIDLAIRALGEIEAAKRPKLVWVGNSSNETYLNKMKKLAVELAVPFVPQIAIEDSELINLMSRASLMLYTSKLEPFGFAPLEANACNTPVVAIAEGGVRETILHGINGLLVYDRNIEKIAEAVLELLEDRVLAVRLGENGRQRVMKNWGWDRAVDRLEKKFKSVTSKAH